MIRIESLPNTFEPPGHPFHTVRIPMIAEDRVRVRRRLKAPDGCQFALALPTGIKLWPGQILYSRVGQIYVVDAAPEKVIVVHPRDMREAARVGHLIGNMHRDIDLEGDGIAVLYDEVLEDRLLQAGLEIERDERPFHGNSVGEHAH